MPGLGGEFCQMESALRRKKKKRNSTSVLTLLTSVGIECNCRGKNDKNACRKTFILKRKKYDWLNKKSDWVLAKNEAEFV